MLVVGLPLICVLTFQLVKDMAVYEMGVAMTPASQMLEQAMVEETKISQLNGELAGIEQKRAERDNKLAALTEKQAKAKADLEESSKRNSEVRQDAISLTDYQKKELSDVESRQANIIQQFNADTEQLNKGISDLRARRETEVTRNSKWNAEEARIENAHKVKMTEYANKKAAYEKAKSEYDNANFLRRQLMKEPVNPGVAPERESNTVLKPTAVAELDAQIQTKEAELVVVNNKRRERVAQVEADARRMREEFDRRSSTKREESDRKREELSVALATLTKEEKAERDAIDQEFASVLLNVDRIRTEVDDSRKKAD
jgi:DNA repair exonuclease SbcCD ATPase subunit